MRVSFICIFVLFTITSNAQKGWELGGWVGISNYFGDLNTSIRITDPGPAFGAVARYNFNLRTCVKMSLNYGFLHANDANSRNNFEVQRNLSFQSHIFDFSSQLEFNFMPYEHGSVDEYFTPYILAGFSVFHFNPTAELDDQRYSLRDFGTEGQFIGDEYNTISGALLMGGGMKWDINEDLSFNVELGIRKVFTDYVDDVSTTYPNTVQLSGLRGPIAAQLSDRSSVAGIGDEGRQRGNSKDNDMYSFFGISLVKYFGKLDCPTISNQ
jgi:hypothetical protein